MNRSVCFSIVLAAAVLRTHSFRPSRPSQRTSIQRQRQHRRHIHIINIHAPPLYLASATELSAFNATGPEPEISLEDVSSDDLWDASLKAFFNPYKSNLFSTARDWEDFMATLGQKSSSTGDLLDPFWEQIKYEANSALGSEPEAGPQLYQGILSQPSLLVAICTVISHEVQTELFPATAVKNLFLEMLTPEDEYMIRLDLQAVATRSPSISSAFSAILFHNGFHALVCYRVGHRMWLAGRTGLAYYMQSIVSRKYSADIHPACKLGSGTYVRVGAGVVIGETAVVGNDVSILEGVTLGGSGKESGDRHPKVGNGVIIYDGGTVLGNIVVGDGAVIAAKSIVTKAVPPLAIMSGVPARIQGYRELDESAFQKDNLQDHLAIKYLNQWRELAKGESSDLSK
jgi:serine O-acetyltransferase